MKEKIKRFFIKDAVAKDTTSHEEELGNDNEEVAAETVSENSEECNDKPLSEYTVRELSLIKEKFGGNQVVEDLLSEQFAVFAQSRGGCLEEKYESFIKLKELMTPKPEADKEPDIQEKEARLHSGFSGGTYRDVSTGLTKRQMDMARSVGMSFKEYEELLNTAPSGRKNRF